MNEIIFLADALITREAFEALPALVGFDGGLVGAVKNMGGQLCRTMIERDGVHAWHACAWLYINGSERVAAARVRLGRFQSED